MIVPNISIVSYAMRWPKALYNPKQNRNITIRLESTRGKAKKQNKNSIQTKKFHTLTTMRRHGQNK